MDARLLRGVVASLLLSCAVPSEAEGGATPGFAELERAGAVIREVRVEARNIFDLDSAEESGLFYRTANRLHRVTRPRVVSRMLLFKSGETVSARKVAETERLLRTLRTIHDVDIRPTRYADGMVDIEVSTRDTWSLDVTGSFSRSGGDNKSEFGVRERNLFGTGLSLGFGRVSNADRNGTELDVGYNQAFDGWTQVAFGRGRFDDGSRTTLRVERPFYSLDARAAGRIAWEDDDRIDTIYNAGDTVSEYRHRLQGFDVAAGWSPGLVDGWTQRVSVGVFGSDDAYRIEPGKDMIFPLPLDHRVRAPFVRYELIEEEFIKVQNYNNIARTEFFSLGFHLRAQLGRALTGFGSTRSDWLYSVQAGDGATFPSGHRLLGQLSAQRRVASTATPMTQVAAALQLYAPVSGRTLYYASVAADRIRGGGVADQLLAGGAAGLRGYPSRYQAGENRVLATIEYRRYTDWYPFHLARVGAAAFVDVGRAWGGPNQNLVNGGWLADAGVGLRIALDRTAFANVLHLDVAVPLRRASGVKAVQFLLKTELGF